MEKLRRLRQMSRAEIWYRMSEKARIERERLGVRTGRKPAAERDLLEPLGGGLRDTSARRAASR